MSTALTASRFGHGTVIVKNDTDLLAILLARAKKGRQIKHVKSKLESQKLLQHKQYAQSSLGHSKSFPLFIHRWAVIPSLHYMIEGKKFASKWYHQMKN